MAPNGNHFFGALNDLIGCGHRSGSNDARIRNLLMLDRVPTPAAAPPGRAATLAQATGSSIQAGSIIITPGATST